MGIADLVAVVDEDGPPARGVRGVVGVVAPLVVVVERHMNVTVTPAAKGSYLVVALGTLSERVYRDVAASFRRAAKTLGVDEATVRAAVDAYDAAQAAAPAAPGALPLVADVATVQVWSPGSEEVQVGAATPLAALLDGIQAAWTRDLEFIRWDNRRVLAAVDVDVNPGAGFTEDELGAIVEANAGPLPAVAWLTKSRGLRYVFVDDAGLGYRLTAEEKAGVFALLAAELAHPKVKKVELIAVTRRPPGGIDSVYDEERRYGVRDLRGRLRASGGDESVTEAERTAWLEEHGMRIGGRYDHSRCPGDPCPTSGTDPISVHDDGIKCFRCAGTTGRGYFSWSWLVSRKSEAHAFGEAQSDPAMAAAVYRVHWAHAELVLAARYPKLTAPLRRYGYMGLLKILNDQDPERADLVAEIMSLRHVALRGETAWLSEDRDPVPLSAQAIRGLPWARGSAYLADLGGTAGRLPGFSPVRPTRGLVDLPTWDETERTVLLPRYRKATECRPPVREAPESHRTLLARLASTLGLDPAHLTAVKILVVGSLLAERAKAAPPMVLLDGASGSGKGLVVHLAAGVFGERPAKLDTVGAADEFDRSLGDGAERGAAILFGDEIGKIDGFWSKSSSLLQTTGYVSWRAMYRGHVTARLRSLVVLAGSTLPAGLVSMSELHRRMVVVRLPGADASVSRSWSERLADAYEGVADASQLRTTPLGTELCEAVLEWGRAYVDGLGACPPSWIDVAVGLGADALTGEEEGDQLDAVVEALYEAWRSAPVGAFVSPKARSAFASGWLRANATSATDAAKPVADLIGEFLGREDDSTDRQRSVTVGRLGKLESADCRRILGVPVRLRAKLHGRKVYVRFVSDLDRRAWRDDTTAFPPRSL